MEDPFFGKEEVPVGQCYKAGYLWVESLILTLGFGPGECHPEEGRSERLRECFFGFLWSTSASPHEDGAFRPREYSIVVLPFTAHLSSVLTVQTILMR